MALAPQIANPGTQGQNARYDVSGLPRDERGYFDGVYHYDDNGLALDRPDSWVEGLPGANDNGPGGAGGGPAMGGGLLGSALSSPWYQQALAATQASEAAEAAARRAAIQQALIQFGLVPQNFQDKYGDIDDTTRNLATQNTGSGISIAARLQQALSDAQRQSSRNLAARGLRRSGARGYQMRRNQLSYDQNYSDAISKLLGGINETYRGYAQGQYGRAMSLAQALRDSLNNWTPRTNPPGTRPPSTDTSTRSTGYVTPTYNPTVSQPNVPFFDVGGGYKMAGGTLRASEGLF